MKLLLTSAGFSNKSIIDAFLDLAGKPFNELDMVFIPTAANVESGDKGWLIDDLANCRKLGFKSIDIVDIAALSKDIWFSRVKDADVIYVEGGNNFYLMKCFEDSGFKEVLSDFLKTKVYVGVSAGSMIMSKSNDLCMSERLWSEEVGEYEKDEALGYVDFLIRPHLNSPYFPKVNLENLEKISMELPENFYAIDDQTAIKVVNSEVEIVSEGVWKKFN